MDFHQSAAERFAESVFNYVSEKFDGKVVNSDECNVELMLKKLPKDFDDDIDHDINPDTSVDTVETTEPTTSDNGDELFTDNIVSPKDNKKKDTSDKKPRKPNKCIYFRTHPDNQSAISEKAKEPHPDKPGKTYGKRDAGCAIWSALSDSEKDEWNERCMTAHSD